MYVACRGQKCVVDGDPPVINGECLLTQDQPEFRHFRSLPHPAADQEPYRSPTTVVTTSTCH